MGSGASAATTWDQEENIRYQKINTTIWEAGNIIYSLAQRIVSINDGKLSILELDGKTACVEIGIDDKMEISYERSTEKNDITVRDTDYTILLSFQDINKSSNWYRFIHEEILVIKSKLIEEQNRGLDSLLDMLNSLETDGINETNDIPPTESIKDKVLELHDSISPPTMKIVILVVGTRGDVQPFVNLGLELKSRGHVVRIATHSEYRQDVVKEGLLFYPLAGISYPLHCLLQLR